jgi:hypothetical protein
MEKPATFRSLSEAYRASLQRRGILDKIKAELRAEMYHVLQGDPKLGNAIAARPLSRSSSNAAVQDYGRNPLPPLEYYMINEMIHEFLCFHGFNHTASVLEVESQMRKEDSLGRDFIQRELDVYERTGYESCVNKSLPLLYCLSRKTK